MADRLEGKKIAFLTANEGVEQVELTEPLQAVREAGAEAQLLASPSASSATAPWTLIDAGIVKGRTLTSWPSLQTDLQNAGAEWVDEEIAEGVHEGQKV